MKIFHSLYIYAIKIIEAIETKRKAKQKKVKRPVKLETVK